MDPSGEYSLYQFFLNNTSERVMYYVDFDTVTAKAAMLIKSVGAKIGTTRRVIITDGGDFTIFEWQYGKGITFPRPEWCKDV